MSKCPTSDTELNIVHVVHSTGTNTARLYLRSQIRLHPNTGCIPGVVDGSRHDANEEKCRRAGRLTRTIGLGKA